MLIQKYAYFSSLSHTFHALQTMGQKRLVFFKRNYISKRANVWAVHTICQHKTLIDFHNQLSENFIVQKLKPITYLEFGVHEKCLIKHKYFFQYFFSHQIEIIPSLQYVCCLYTESFCWKCWCWLTLTQWHNTTAERALSNASCICSWYSNSNGAFFQRFVSFQNVLKANTCASDLYWLLLL